MPQSCTSRSFFLVLLWLVLAALTACSSAKSSPAETSAKTLSKTLFTEKLGVFLTYQSLTAGKASEVTLHLTDLAAGTPVDKAEVSLTARAKRDQSAINFKATQQEPGIYAAQITLPKQGEYYLELQLTHPQFSERLTMSDFDVE